MGSPSFNLLAFSKEPNGGIVPNHNSSRELTEIPPFFKSLQWYVLTPLHLTTEVRAPVTDKTHQVSGWDYNIYLIF
jgi:hypothetical protein